MKHLDKIIRTLQDHEKRIRVLESKTKKSGSVVSGDASATKHLRDHILDLRSKSFFKQPRTMEETHKKLGEIYPCEKKRVGVELIRLHNKKQLRKISKMIGKKKIVAYVC